MRSRCTWENPFPVAAGGVFEKGWTISSFKGELNRFVTVEAPRLFCSFLYGMKHSLLTTRYKKAIECQNLTIPLVGAVYDESFKALS
jgi:hypothetical protein